MPSYEKNKSSGLWSARFREPDENGIQRQKRLSGFKTKKEAQYGYEDYIKNKEAEKAKKDLAPAEPQTRPEDMSFSELYESWLKYKKSRTKETSHYDVKNKCDARIAPYFSDMTVGEITPAKVLSWQIDELEGFSYAYKKTLVNLLSSIFIYGEKYHNIKNVMKNVDKPRNLEKKKEMQIWSPDELGKVLDNTDREDIKTLFLFLYFSGCRRGEALALTWNDLDLKSGAVRINKSITNKVHDGDKPYAIVDPKNKASIRDITLPKQVTDALSEYKEKQKQQNGAADDSFVFGGKRPIPFTSIERELKLAAEKAGVKKIRLHDFRHSCASALISSGVSIVAVSRHLGHSDIQQTLNTYSHMMPDDKTAIRNALEKVGQKLKK